jgi:hypothetical protein
MIRVVPKTLVMSVPGTMATPLDGGVDDARDELAVAQWRRRL